MNKKFQASIQHQEQITYLTLVGVIDEDNKLAELTEKITEHTVAISLGKIERINSSGVRDWMHWISSLQDKGKRIALLECSTAIVAQINIIDNFIASAIVKSFYIPYYCSECEQEQVLLHEVVEMSHSALTPPVNHCDTCDFILDFDDIPENYFSFIVRQIKRLQGKQVQALLQAIHSNSERPFNIEAPAPLLIHQSTKPLTEVPTVPSPIHIHPQKKLNSEPSYTVQSISEETERVFVSQIQATQKNANHSSIVLYTFIALLLSAIVTVFYFAMI